MQDHPERYTDEEIRQLMADEECRLLYQQMVNAADALHAEKGEHRAQTARFTIKHVAALLVGLLMLSGIAYATISVFSDKEKNTEVATTAKTEKPTEEKEAAEAKDSVARFDNARLDSVMAIVASHYHKQVEYQGASIRGLHLHIEWNQAAPLADFIDLMNNFEDINLREDNGTIYVGTTLPETQDN